MFDRRLIQYFDWGLLGLAVLIGCIGLLTLYSAVTAETPTPQKILFFKQMLWFCIGLLAMVTAFLFNYKILDRWAQPIYFVCILMLIAVLFFGRYVGGSRRWLIIGPLSFQPSELVKIAVILSLAHYYSKDAKTRGFTLRELIRPPLLRILTAPWYFHVNWLRKVSIRLWIRSIQPPEFWMPPISAMTITKLPARFRESCKNILSCRTLSQFWELMNCRMKTRLRFPGQENWKDFYPSRFMLLKFLPTLPVLM